MRLVSLKCQGQAFIVPHSAECDFGICLPKQFEYLLMGPETNANPSRGHPLVEIGVDKLRMTSNVHMLASPASRSINPNSCRPSVSRQPAKDCHQHCHGHEVKGVESIRFDSRRFEATVSAWNERLSRDDDRLVPLVHKKFRCLRKSETVCHRNDRFFKQK
jgi:hypothetical protein